MTESILFILVGGLAAEVSFLYMQLRTLRRKTGESFLLISEGMKLESDRIGAAVTGMAKVSRETISATEAQFKQQAIALGSLFQALEELGNAVGVTRATGRPKGSTDSKAN